MNRENTDSNFIWIGTKMVHHLTLGSQVMPLFISTEGLVYIVKLWEKICCNILLKMILIWSSHVGLHEHIEADTRWLTVCR